MITRELKCNLKSFIIWSSLLIILFLVVFLVYPSIVNSSEINSINEMMTIFPEEILKAFNMDLASIDTAYGWLKSEGLVFILLIIGSYSSILGSTILLKEESDKTIEYLNNLPIKRSSIVLSKVLVGIAYILLLCFVIGIFNFICLTLSGDFNIKEYILLSFTPLYPSLVLFFICMFISTFTHKTKKTTGISLGIVLVCYFLNVLSTISEKVEFLKYFTVFTLSDIRNIMMNTSFNINMIIISLILSLVFLVAIIFKYNKKELV